MPELPDVENFKRVLAHHALGKTIAAVSVHDARILGSLSARKFVARVRGRQVAAALRHGKQLLAELDGDLWLTLHFGMSGGLTFVERGGAEPSFTRLRFDLAGDGALAYTNKRMLGRVGLVSDAADFIAAEKLGPDALDERFDFAAFQKAVGASRRTAKSVLMDQHVVAGIGNIYSDEILFQARISPLAALDTLPPSALKRLFVKMRTVLETAIARGAGSEEFVERMPKGALLRQRKRGGRCPRCGTPLKILKIAGRSAYCCPKCQGC